MRVGALLAVVALALPRAASADDGSDEPTDHDREVHAGVIAGMSATYLVVEFGLGHTLAPSSCRWCEPPGIDASVRDAVRWNDTKLASTMSTVTGYAMAPIAATSLLVAADWGAGWRRHYDDIAPVLESALAVSLVHHAVKFTVARQRPFVHYAPPGTLAPTDEDNVSFYSGHTSLAFALAVSAGTVATTRGYRIAPAVWATGLTLAATTGYLRMAADKHYFIDVTTGAVMGTVVGFVWPRVVNRYLKNESTKVIPTSSGIAVIGSF